MVQNLMSGYHLETSGMLQNSWCSGRQKRAQVTQRNKRPTYGNLGRMTPHIYQLNYERESEVAMLLFKERVSVV